MRNVLDTAAALRPRTGGDWLALSPVAALVAAVVAFGLYAIGAAP